MIFIGAAVILVNCTIFNPVLLAKRTVKEGKNGTLVGESSLGFSSSINVSSEDILARGGGTKSVIRDLLNDEILPRLSRIKSICGTLCTIDSMEAFESLITEQNNGNGLFPELRVPVDCEKLMTSEDIDAGDTSVPYPLPAAIKHLYSLSGAVEIRDLYHLADVYLGGEHGVVWDEELLSSILVEIESGTHAGSYGVDETNGVRIHLSKTLNMEGTRVLVIGSERPWLEAICLFLGAKEVVTLEYGRIVSTHPKVKTLVPSEFRERYMQGTLGQFDAVVSYSSIEHSGLGRYGDALNPWGDILAVARSWCVTKPGGALALGLPTGKDGIDMNAHRIYGKVRWPLVTANWRQIDHHLHGRDELDWTLYRHSTMVFQKND